MTSSAAPRRSIAELVFSIALLVLFAWAFVEAGNWSFRAALYPRIVAVAGLLTVMLRLAVSVFGGARAAGAPAPTLELAGVAVVDEEEAEQQDVEYVFAHAGRQAWIEALGWVAGFFVALWVLGLYITVPLFCVLYLKLVAKASWLVAVVYAAVAWLVLFLAFTRFLSLPVPEGIFG